MNIYLIGSLAFDEIGKYKGDFVDLFQCDLIDDLSVSMVVENTARFFGGCAGNTAYSLGLLGVPATICTLLGTDGHFYKDALKESGMNTDYIEILDGHTAHVMIATDLGDRQIAQFAPGVIGETAPYFHLPKEATKGDIILVEPENHDRMIQAVEQSSKKGLRVFFDPGQMIHTFSKKELMHLIELSDGVFVNDYEWGLLKNISGLNDKALLAKLNLVFVTHGADGVDWYENGEEHFEPALPAQAVDPTGAGDAFRAGVLAGIYKGLSIKNSVKIGIILGSACVEYQKPQGHHLTDPQMSVLKSLGF